MIFSEFMGGDRDLERLVYVRPLTVRERGSSRELRNVKTFFPDELGAPLIEVYGKSEIWPIAMEGIGFVDVGLSRWSFGGNIKSIEKWDLGGGFLDDGRLRPWLSLVRCHRGWFPSTRDTDELLRDVWRVKQNGRKLAA